ncbi:MAG: DedA family protein [Pseudomonadota bacterium]|nr:MAG: DedA family protein [Pseudomonadota bacterium]
MESSLIAGIIEFARVHPGWLVGMALVFAFLESLAIVGLFIPGIVLLFIVGAVVGSDPVLFAACWASASSGALAGDLVSYGLGRRYRDRIDRLWILRRRADLLAAARGAVATHGRKGLFFGRLIGPLRPLTPLVAGMMDLPVRRLLSVAVPACIIWSPLYLLPGMLFGASLSLAAEFAGRLVAVLIILVAGVWLAVWLTRLVYGYTARRSAWWLRSLIRWSRDHPVIGGLARPLFEPASGRREAISVALLGLLLLACIGVLAAVLTIAPLVGGDDQQSVQALAGLAASLRTQTADPLFITLGLAGDLPVMGLVAGLMTILMVALGRGNAAAHWLVATAGGWLLAEVLAALMSLTAPAPALLPALGELPHRGLTLTTVVLGFFAVMIAKDLAASRRKWPYLINSALLTMMVFSHFYLARASLSGLLAALALGGGWLALVGMAYRQRALQRRHPAMLAVAFYALIVAATALQFPAGYGRLADITRMALPERSLARDDWLTGQWRSLPQQRSQIGDAARQRFDFQYAGPVDAFEDELARSGWVRPGERSGGLAALLSVPPRRDALPHLPRDFAGHRERLVLVRPLDEDRKAVLRLWDSGVALDPGAVPVWLGQVRIEGIGEFLLLLHRWRETGDARRAMAVLERSLGSIEVIDVEDGGRVLLAY